MPPDPASTRPAGRTGPGSAAFLLIGVIPDLTTMVAPFLLPVIKAGFGVAGAMRLFALFLLAGLLLTLVLPEPAGRSLDDVPADKAVVREAESVLRSTPEVSA